MLFPLFSSAVLPATHLGGASAPNECVLVKCLLANTLGLEDCRIDVEIVNGVIILSGKSTSEAAVRHAAAVATDFTSKQVVSGVQVSGYSHSA